MAVKVSCCCQRARPSATKVEKVVKPPQSPTVRKRRSASGAAMRESQPLSRPMSRQPRALAAKVLHGKRPSAAPGRSNVRR